MLVSVSFMKADRDQTYYVSDSCQIPQPLGDITVTSILQVRKVLLREVEKLAGQHTAYNPQSWDTDCSVLK